MSYEKNKRNKSTSFTPERSETLKESIQILVLNSSRLNSQSKIISPSISNITSDNVLNSEITSPTIEKPTNSNVNPEKPGRNGRLSGIPQLNTTKRIFDRSSNIVKPSTSRYPTRQSPNNELNTSEIHLQSIFKKFRKTIFNPVLSSSEEFKCYIRSLQISLIYSLNYLKNPSEAFIKTKQIQLPENRIFLN